MTAVEACLAGGSAAPRPYGFGVVAYTGRWAAVAAPRPDAMTVVRVGSMS